MDLIACDNGPGSFTGIRIGISSVKAMAEAIEIPVISISSLEALSYNVEDESMFIMSDGSFALVFNEDIHRPGLKVNDELIEKVVIKIRVK